MANRQVKFSRKTNFTGRNGFMKCSGIDLQSADSNKILIISAITGRGQIGRCDIFVPVEEIDNLAAALITQKIKMKREAK